MNGNYDSYTQLIFSQEKCYDRESKHTRVCIVVLSEKFSPQMTGRRITSVNNNNLQHNGESHINVYVYLKGKRIIMTPWYNTKRYPSIFIGIWWEQYHHLEE